MFSVLDIINTLNDVVSNVRISSYLVASLWFVLGALDCRMNIFLLTFPLLPHFKCHQANIYIIDFSPSTLFCPLYLAPPHIWAHFLWSSEALLSWTAKQSPFRNLCYVLCNLLFHHHVFSQLRFRIFVWCQLIMLYMAPSARYLVVFFFFSIKWAKWIILFILFYFFLILFRMNVRKCYYMYWI